MLILALAAATTTSAADRLTLSGQFVQGGMITGHTEPGTELRLGERLVRVAADGGFVFGFGRDHGPTAELTAHYPDGSVERRTVEVAEREYRIQRIEGLPKKMVTPPAEVLARIRSEAARIAEVRRRDSVEPFFAAGFAWPLIGPITGVFGSQRVLNGKPRRPHFGVDIAGPTGSPIHAPADGVVALVDPDLYFTGGTVMLDHGHGLTSVYSHMQSVAVPEGARVRRGDVIGTLGATGRATGPHLDWRLNWFDQRLDPALIVGPMPKASGGG
jgi:murein DD-endopeptidase MepM/ murein hydrolase activator NlpD